MRFPQPPTLPPPPGFLQPRAASVPRAAHAPGPPSVQNRQCFMPGTSGLIQSQRLSLPGPPRYERPNQSALQTAAHLACASPRVGQPDWQAPQSYGQWPEFRNQSPRPVPMMSTTSNVAPADICSQQTGTRELRPAVISALPPGASALRQSSEYAGQLPPGF